MCGLRANKNDTAIKTHSKQIVCKIKRNREMKIPVYYNVTV